MKIYRIVLFLCLLFWVTTERVVELNDQSFKSIIQNNKYVFVYFYSHNCEKCMGTEVQFPKLSSKIEGLEIVLAKVDGTANQDLVKSLKVPKFPTLILFDRGQAIGYRGSHSSSNQMKKWIDNYLWNRIESIESETEDMKKPYLLIKGGLQEQIEIINSVLYDIERFHAYQISGGQDKKLQISLHLKDSKNLQFLESFNRAKLRQWIEENIKTVIQPLKNKQSNDKVLFNKNYPGLVIVFTENDRRNYEKFNIMVEVCEQNKEKIVCGEILPQYQTYEGSHGFFQVKDTNRTFVAMVKQGMRIAYRMQEPFQSLSKSNLQKFVDNALQNKIKRVVDNTLPTSTQFQHVKVLNPQDLQKSIQSNKYVFVNFYKEGDTTSLIFSRRYQILAESISSESQLKSVGIVALDCAQHLKYCEQQGIGYYPYLLFYISGIKVPYPKSQKLPQIPEITRYLHGKKTKTFINLKEQDVRQLQKPVVHSSIIPAQLQVLPALCEGSYKIYHRETQSEEVTIYLHHLDQVSKYEGQFNVNDISSWINSETSILLSDIMQNTYEQKLTLALKNKEPFILLLSSSKDKQKKFKMKLGRICKKLQFLGTFSDDFHSQFKDVLKWIGFEELEESKLVYVDLGKDRKYVYEQNLDEMSSQRVQAFIQDVKEGKVRSTVEKPKDEQPEKTTGSQQL